ncbi:MAG: SpaH/EbpB family LPXTG-anchored major pilin [Lachnospiraceae bacterium]|nr:SpaH/EbpB family LPXTG-anchored major pilin [Lachnospiraceae bacterium]
MKGRMLKRMTALVLAGLLAMPGMNISTAMAEESVPEKKVYSVNVSVSDVEITTVETKSALTSIQSERLFDENGNEIKKLNEYYDATHFHYDKVLANKLKLAEKPVWGEFAHVGSAEYSWYYATLLNVYYQRNAEGEILRDSEGNPLIQRLVRAWSADQSDVKNIVDAEGNVIQTLDYPFGTGTRPVMFWLRDVDGNYITAYCTDILTGTSEGSWYQLFNLEDSSYYADDIEDHLRAVAENGYWGSAEGTGSLPAVKAALKAAIQNGEIQDYVVKTKTEIVIGDDGSETEVTDEVWLSEMIDDMTAGEALDATAAAVWHWGNQGVGDDIVFTGVVRSGEDNDKARDALRLAYYNWLINLQPVEAKDVIITEDNFVQNVDVKVDEVLVESADSKSDVFDAALTFTMGTIPEEGDDLLLEITHPDKSGVDVTVIYRLAGENKEGQDYTKLTAVDGVYTIADLELAENQKFDIEMRIFGEQKLERQAFFLDAGGREKSQSMLTLAEGTHKVDYTLAANVIFNADEVPQRILKFHKTTKVGEGENAVEYPLEGIEFDIYYLCSVEEYNQELQNGETKYENPTLDLVTEEDYVATVKTDEGGNAVYNLTLNENPDGIYLIAEKEHDAVAKILAPFLVAVPMADDKGEPVYVIELNPKNEIVRPEIDKDVTEIGQKIDTMDMDENVMWIVRGDIPKDIAKAKSYVLTDVLDYRLTYTGGLVVKVEKIADPADNSAEGTDVLLEKEDYVLTISDATIEVTNGEEAPVSNATKKIEIELTEAGRAKIAAMVGAEFADYELRVYFNTYIDEDAMMGVEIPNEVTLEYTNSANFQWTIVPKEIPEVYTCGINVHKFDAKDDEIALAGAVFKLAEVVDKETEGAAALVIKNAAGAVETVYVVYKDFYVDAACTIKANTITTDENGDALIFGLEAGTYYLVEIKAPNGYNLLSYPVQVTLDQTSHHIGDIETTQSVEIDRTVYVANSNTFRLPETGGIGTAVFTLVGSLMMGGAGVMLVNKKRDEE